MIPVLAIALLAQTGRIAPVSDAARTPGFPVFLAKLKAAVGKRDAKALHKLTDEDVILGGFTEKDEKGWAKFAWRWRVDDKQGEVWHVLGDLLDLGFFREAPGTLVSPYLAWKFPRDLDPASHLVVLRDVLPLRTKPDRNAPVTATLSFDIVRPIESYRPQAAFEWIEVETLSGIRGFVQSSNVRSPLMPRAQFSKRDGQWKLFVLDKGRF